MTDHQLPIDLNRWQAAVAQLRAALLEPNAAEQVADLRHRYGIAGVVVCYMTDEQRRIAEPQLAEISNLIRRFAQ